MDHIICSRCGNKLPKNYSLAESDATHYLWRCAKCGQEYVEAKSPVISLTYKGDLPEDTKVEIMDSIGEIKEVTNTKDEV